MRKWAVTDVVQENGDLRGFEFRVADVNALFAKALQRPAHEMHGAQRMMKARVNRTGIDEVADTQLPYEPQPLKVRMGDQVEDQRTGNGNKSIDGIVNDFVFVQGLKEIIKS